MEYYRITQIDNWENVIRPEILSISEIWEKSEAIFLPGISDTSDELLTFLPFYESNVFLISEPVKLIWERYQKGGRYRPCAFGSVKQRRILPYSFMMPRILEGIHSDTRYYPNGDIKELYLDREVIGAHRVFGIRSIRHIWLIVSADVLEEMMRENLTGYHWTEVNVVSSIVPE
jgi:hypothetical protein